ncbi:MAG: glycosyltransferase family 2 protein [Candidatus Omnitrophica bacterium]|nr:glycosyltransferase family 2 protein [Candidatus Omnitrophota bacterium]
MIDLSIIVPSYNEEGNIKELVLKILDEFDKIRVNGEVVLIDDCSFDGTGLKIKELSSQFKNVLGITHSRNMGITEAWNSGLKSSQGKHVLTIDADLQYRPEDIGILYREMAGNNYDLVQGWRRKYKDRSLFRKFLSRSLSCILNLLFFVRLHDIKSGFVIYKRDVFLGILKDRKRYRAFQHFFILSALKKGYRLKQVPVTFYPRKRGKSFIKNPILFSFKVMLDIPRAIFDFGIIKRSD